MRCRMGHVSNSSSSSFVVMGFLLDKDKYDLLELYKKLLPGKEIEAKNHLYDEEDFYHDKISNSDMCLAYHSEDGSPDGKYMIGVKLADGSEYGFDYKEVDMALPMDRVSKIKDAIGVDVETKVYVGTRLC